MVLRGLFFVLSNLHIVIKPERRRGKVLVPMKSPEDAPRAMKFIGLHQMPEHEMLRPVNASST
jgi:hypothetical protein